MPRYTYHCDKCDETFNIVHSMSEEATFRDECNNNCNLKKIPSNLTILHDINVDINSNKKIGQVVNKSIEESRKELKEEKRKLRNEVYKDD